MAAVRYVLRVPVRPPEADLRAIRAAIAAMPADVSHDASGSRIPQLEEVYAPEAHANALDPAAPLVQGARGTGKSFWSGVLGDPSLRSAAARAYPRLGLDRVKVRFGYTGIAGPDGIDREKLEQLLPSSASTREAKDFFWATILRAVALDAGETLKLSEALRIANDIEEREARLSLADGRYQAKREQLMVVYDAIDTMAREWPRRRMLTEALLEVVWAMRAYRSLRVKVFVRPDQLQDDALRFVELPKLRNGAVLLTWSSTDLYGLLFARLLLGEAGEAFTHLLGRLGVGSASQEDVLARRWSLAFEVGEQERVMSALAGAYMGEGPNAHKKGKTYEWPIKHLGDAFAEVTPRSFLVLFTAAAKQTPAPEGKVLTPAGIQHGLRAASKMRVDQLHQELPWIKGVLVPLAGLLLPTEEAKVHAVWRKARTLTVAIEEAERLGYLPPVPVDGSKPSERDLYLALERFGVMMRRKDDRVDMPDLFRVAARLLKKGGTAPI